MENTITSNRSQNEETSQTEAILTQPEAISDSGQIENKPSVERDELGRLKKGSVLNPNGVRSPKNWETYYWEGLKKLAELNGKEADDFDIEFMSKYLELARKGDLRALKDMFDRRFGKPKETHEVSGIDGEPIKTVNEVKWIVIDGEQNT